MKINFNTENIIIACYSRGAGGKLILNSLGLSDSATLQDSGLAQQQLNKQLSQYDKFNLLLARLEKTTTVWNDLELGCQELFNDVDYQNKFLQIKESFNFSPVVSTLSTSNLKFFLVEHQYYHLDKKISVWPNATIIFFDNEQAIIKCRPGYSKRQENTRLKLYWDSVRGTDWPVQPPKTIQEIKKLDKFIQDELSELFNNEILSYVADEIILDKIEKAKQQLRQQVAGSNNVLTWDCRWSLDPDLFLTNIEIFYQKLGLDNFNSDYLKQFHRLWLEKILEIQLTTRLKVKTAPVAQLAKDK